jgi:hypothetical protein
VGNDVFANGRELACKAGSGKSICAFPDVCMTPPMTPATPPGVPVPYPNTGMASDTTSGSTTVKISGKEVMLKNKSYFKSSTGDEAGCATKKGVVSSVNRGKVYFAAWSMDVKIEGENAVRHLDLTTHNHGSAPQTPPWPFADSMNIVAGETKDPCAKEKKAETKACAKHKGKRTKECDDDKCQKAQACKLVPYGGPGSPNCCPGVTGHHLVEVHCFSPTGLRGHELEGLEGYDQNQAPTACAPGARDTEQHGVMHAVQGAIEAVFAKKPIIQEWIDPDGKPRVNESRWRYKNARDAGVAAQKIANPQCSEACTKAQLDEYHKNTIGCGENTPLRTDPVTRSSGTLTKSQKRELVALMIGL